VITIYDNIGLIKFMIILGVDPGIGRCGWGIIKDYNSSQKVLGFGCIETNAGLSLEKRLEEVYSQILKIIKKYSPNALAIEDLFFGNNSKTALVVGQARGVIILASFQNKLSINSYTPLEVKIALTGYGKAEKSQVGQMVKTILKLNSVPKPDDTADALAVGLTHAFFSKLKNYTK
jgi:crossover junction endodeoxyribonuclease RuvC